MSSWRDAPVVEDQEQPTAQPSPTPSWMSAPAVETPTPQPGPKATPSQWQGAVDVFAPEYSQRQPVQPPAPAAEPTPAPSAPTELPPPTMNMYSDVGSWEEAKALYEQYRTSPGATTSALGEINYKGRVVPFPQRGLFGYGPGPSQYVSGMVTNIGRNIAETTGAALDVAGAQFQLFNEKGEWDPAIGEDVEGGVEPGIVSRFAQSIPRVKAEPGTAAEFAMEGGQSALGGIFAMKGADRLVEGIKPLANSATVKSLAKVLGFELGSAVSVDQDVSTLFLGPNAVFKNDIPLLRGAQPGIDDSEAEKVLKNRLNILTEAAMLAKPAEGLVKGAAWTANTIWSVGFAPIVNAFRKGSKEDAIVNDILNQLTLIGSKNDESSAQAKKNIVDLIEQNQDVLLKIGQDYGDDIRVTLDTMSALEKAVAGSKADEVLQLTARLRGIRTGALNQAGGAPLLSVASTRPQRAFEQATQQVEATMGGSEAIEASRRGLVESGQAEIQAARNIAEDIDLRLADAESNLDQLIKNDPTFGKKLDDLNNSSGVMVYTGPSQTMDSIVANTRQAYESMTAAKNELYNQIEGGVVEPEGLIKVLNELRPGQLDAAAGAMPASSPFGALLDQVRPRQVEVPGPGGQVTTRMETEDEVLERFSEWMGANNLDFSTLYRDIRPAVSQTAESLFASSSPEAQGAARVLRDFTNYIDSKAIDDLIASGDDDIADAARQAKDYYMTEYAPYWRDGVLKDVADLYGQTIGRTSEAMAERGLQVRPIDFQAGARQTLEGAIADTQREYAGQIVSLLNRPEAGQNAPLVTDFIIGRAVDTIDNALSTGGRLSDMDLGSVVGELRRYRDVVAGNFPEQAQRINQFVENIATSRGNIEALRGQLDEAKQIAKQAEDAIYSGELSKFFRGVGIENPNGYAVFDSILSDPANANVVQSLVQRAQATGDPIVLQGMKAAYARHIRNRFLGTTQEIGGNRTVNLRPITQEAEQVRNTLDYGEQIFADSPEVVEAIRTSLELAGAAARSRGARPVATDSATASRLEAIRASNQMITQLFGVLSRTGARIRAGSTTLINKLSPDEAGARILDTVLANPEEFTRIARRVVQAQARRERDPDIRDALYSFLVRGGIYSNTTEDYEDFVVGMAQAEMDMERGMENVGQQMNEMLFPRGR